MTVTSRDDLSRHMARVAEALLGAPNQSLSKQGKEWRYGTHGSLAIDLQKGTYFDFETNKGGGILDLIKREKGISGADATDFMRQIDCDLPPRSGNGVATISSRKLVASFDYTDANGQLVFQVLRYEPKGFLQRRPDGNGGWQFRRGAPLPYRLPDLIEAIALGRTVFVVEGEGKVNALANWNVPATSSAEGAKKWKPEHSEYLRGADVVILPDNDNPGRDHANVVGASLQGIASRVRVLELPGLGPKGDIVNWIEAGGTPENFWKLVDSEARQWTPSDHPIAAIHPSWTRGAISARDLQQKHFDPVRYLLPGYIPEGVTLLVGKPKIGKSWAALDLCIAAASNRFTLGTIKPAQGDVLYIALEDSQRRLKRRMTKLLPDDGAWPERLTLQTQWRRAGDGGLDDIREWCQSVSAPTLVMIDTLEKFRPLPNARLQNYSADYEAITGLQEITKDNSGLSIVLAHHARKMDAADPFDTVSGTFGLTGAADTVLIMRRNAGSVLLNVRGRDVEETETSLQFNKATCRWTILGAEAAEAAISAERRQILDALEAFPLAHERDGMSVPEIMTATGRTDRNAVDQLLYKMGLAGEIRRVRRGVYSLPKEPGKIDKKERNGAHLADFVKKTGNLTDLTDLTAGPDPGVEHRQGLTVACDQCRQPAAEGDPLLEVFAGENEVRLHRGCVSLWKSELVN
jgi:hypothetical protein